MNSEINLIFLIKPFSFMTRKSWQKLKYLENEKSFEGEITSIFLGFLKGHFSVAKNCLTIETWECESVSLNCFVKTTLF